MRNHYLLIFGIILFAATACHTRYLQQMIPVETYPADSWLAMQTEKRALIIVAHDDDMATAAGTISMLCADGWMIREMCFYQQGGLYNVKDSIKNPIRKQSLQTVAAIQGMAGVDPIDFNFRNDMQTLAPYMPMPYTDFSKNFKVDSMLGYIGNYIQQYRPTVIFTLDPVIGGYGNPDHVFVSQMVLQYCSEHKNDPGFSVQKIYHPVYPPSQSVYVPGNMEVFQEAKKVYGCNGMPDPHVQINIVPYAAQKKAVFEAYTTEQNSLRKIWPYYYKYPAEKYFGWFDRDFFYITDVSSL